MTSLAQRHRAKTLARQSGETKAIEASVPRAAASEYEMRRAELGEDLRELKALESVEAKIARKAKLIGKYDDWVDGVIAAATGDDGELKRDAGVQDDILMQTMVWAIDTVDHVRALPRARYALRYGLELPARFERNLACLIVEEFAENALKALTAGEAPDISVLLQIDDLADDEDMPDQVRAKLHKAIGLTIARDAENEDAAPALRKAATDKSLAQLRRALQLNDKCGVKKSIERLERIGKQLADTSAEEGGEGGATEDKQTPPADSGDGRATEPAT